MILRAAHYVDRTSERVLHGIGPPGTWGSIDAIKGGCLMSKLSSPTEVQTNLIKFDQLNLIE